jgi:hypothetical protein
MNMSGNNTTQTSSIPPWLREESLDDNRPMGTPGVNGYSSVPNNSQSTLSPAMLQRARTIHWGLKVGTMLLCVLMAATAVIGLGEFLYVKYFASNSGV